MPYKPNTIDSKDRSSAYGYIWFSAFCSVIYLASAILGVDASIVGVIWGGAAGGMIVGAFAYYTDDYFQSMCLVGMRCVLMGMAAFILIEAFFSIIDVSHSAGQMLADPEGGVPDSRFALYFTDAKTIIALLAVLFHAGYVYTWLKDRFGR